MSRLTAKRAADSAVAEARHAKEFVVPHFTTARDAVGPALGHAREAMGPALGHARDAVGPALGHARGAVVPVLGQARDAAAPHLAVARDKARADPEGRRHAPRQRRPGRLRARPRGSAAARHRARSPRSRATSRPPKPHRARKGLGHRARSSSRSAPPRRRPGRPGSCRTTATTGCTPTPTPAATSRRRTPSRPQHPDPGGRPRRGTPRAERQGHRTPSPSQNPGPSPAPSRASAGSLRELTARFRPTVGAGPWACLRPGFVARPGGCRGALDAARFAGRPRVAGAPAPVWSVTTSASAEPPRAASVAHVSQVASTRQQDGGHRGQVEGGLERGTHATPPSGRGGCAPGVRSVGRPRRRLQGPGGP